MAFFIKNFETITASLIQMVSEGTTSLTDFNVGSKIRTMLEAYAQEMEFFYLQMMRGIMEGIDTAIYNSFDFPPLSAVAASGLVKISLVEYGTTVPIFPTSAITVAAGTRVQIPDDAATNSIMALAGTTYSVLQDTIWEAGKDSITLAVACDVAGTGGNTMANSITALSDNLPFVANAEYKVTNPLPFVNGTEQEDDSSHKARFARYLQSLARGTLVALETGAETAVVKNSNGTIREQVKTAMAVEPYMADGAYPVGHVDIYVYNGVGGTSEELVSAAQQIIDGYVDSDNNRIPGYKAAGIIASVRAAIEQPISFRIRTRWNSGYYLSENANNVIASAIQTYVSGLRPGDSVIMNKIIELVMGAPGIYNCIIESPNSDVAAVDVRSIITVETLEVVTDEQFDITGETYNT